MLEHTDFRSILFQRIKAFDIELAEDLYRRMPVITTVSELCKFFHLLLAQYETTTTQHRSTLDVALDFEQWYVSFVKELLPFLKSHRLPPCTDRLAKPMYQCESKTLNQHGTHVNG